MNNSIWSLVKTINGSPSLIPFSNLESAIRYGKQFIALAGGEPSIAENELRNKYSYVFNNYRLDIFIIELPVVSSNLQ